MHSCCIYASFDSFTKSLPEAQLWLYSLQSVMFQNLILKLSHGPAIALRKVSCHPCQTVKLDIKLENRHLHIHNLLSKWLPTPFDRSTLFTICQNVVPPLEDCVIQKCISNTGGYAAKYQNIVLGPYWKLRCTMMIGSFMCDILASVQCSYFNPATQSLELVQVNVLKDQYSNNF